MVNQFDHLAVPLARIAGKLYASGGWEHLNGEFRLLRWFYKGFLDELKRTTGFQMGMQN